MNHFENLKKTASTVEGLHEFLSILLVATILTIFEIIFFFKVIAPEVKEEVNGKLKTVAENIGSALFNNTAAITDCILPDTVKTQIENSIKNSKFIPELLIENNVLLDFINTQRDREKELLDKANLYTKIFGVMLIVGLVIAIAIIVFIINRNGKLNKNSLIAAGVTVALLITFQYTFYRFGKKYAYTGSLGNEEFIKLIIEKLEE